MRKLLCSTGCLFLITGLAFAAPGPEHELSWCGTSDERLEESLLRHRAQSERLAFDARLATSAPSVSSSGEVAVIEDDGRLVLSVNLFDLERGVQFKRKKDRVRAASFGGPVRGNLGERLPLGDDDSIEVFLPERFEFPFYGVSYASIFVNSDGNVTLGEPSAGQERSLGALVNGPPRIAPFFTDLDPSQAAGDGGVYALVSRRKAQITWWRVPEFGTSTLNTVQATLFKNGRVTIAYGEVASLEAVVGATPGRGALVDLFDLGDDLPITPRRTGIAERFSAQQEVDDLAIAATFFDHFEDVYDHVIVFLDFQQSLGGAFAFELNVKNEVEGIGLPSRLDLTAAFGSDGRLESYVQMGSLANYRANPESEVFAGFSGLDVLAHEAGHRWLARPRFASAAGATTDILLGRQRSHWSFFFDSDASVMEGNDLRDNGDGTFTSVAVAETYSPLDLYLMGLAPPSEVPPFFYVEGGQSAGAGRETAPRLGALVLGQRAEVTIDDVIAAEGERRPAYPDAPDRFKMAFVLVGQQGAPPSQASIDKVDAYRLAFADFFDQITAGQGRVVTRLEPR